MIPTGRAQFMTMNIKGMPSEQKYVTCLTIRVHVFLSSTNLHIGLTYKSSLASERSSEAVLLVLSFFRCR